MTPRRSPLALLALLLAAAGPPSGTDDGPRLLLGQPRDDYAARRRSLMDGIRSANADRVPIVVLKGANPAEGEDFEEGRFRQSNDFAYLTGIDRPGAALVLLPAEGQATLYLPADRHGLGRPDPAIGATAGFDRVEPMSKLLGDVLSALGDAAAESRRPVVYLPGADARPTSNRPDARFARWLREAAPFAEFREIAGRLSAMRKVKSTAELKLLRRAIAITGDAQAAVAGSIRPGLYEYQLEGKILAAFLDGGALRPGFASIVGSGPNGTIPHYFDNDRRIEVGDLVVVDIGAEYHDYTADITRTYPASGTFTPRQRELYQLVLDCQAHVAAQIRPGETTLNELTGIAREYLKQSPLRARGRDGEEHTMEHFFIHGLGHYLGMDVHDVGDTGEPLRPGEVFTIEPGLYIKPENLGIRIEDDYLVTADGVEKLSEDIPSDLDEIERRIAAGRAPAAP